MSVSRRWAVRAALMMAVVVPGAGLLGAAGLRLSRADEKAADVSRQPEASDSDRQVLRHITVFAVRAIPEKDRTSGQKNGKREGPENPFTRITPQLKQLFPGYEFTLLDARTAQIATGESIDCTLTHGYTIATTLVEPFDEDGKVKLLCELSLDGDPQFNATVRTPLNQLFFCERPYLTDGSRLLIGVSAREF